MVCKVANGRVYIVVYIIFIFHLFLGCSFVFKNDVSINFGFCSRTTSCDALGVFISYWFNSIVTLVLLVFSFIFYETVSIF